MTRYAQLRRVTASGLGDRFGVYLSVAAIAQTAGHVGLCCWANNSDPRRHYPWDTIKHMVCLPRNLRIMEYDEFAAFSMSNSDQICEIDHQHNELPAAEGFDCVYTLAHRALSLPGFQITLESMCASYRHISKEWNINIHYEKPFNSRKYIVLHLRGDDKITSLEYLCSEFVTHVVLDNVPRDLGIIVVSDDEQLTSYYKAFFPSLVVEFPKGAGPHRDLVDLDILMRAKAITQHSVYGWSAYSSIPALAKMIPLLNTCVRKDFNRIDLFASQGVGPPELLRYNEANARLFASHVGAL